MSNSDSNSYLVFICGSALRGQPDHQNIAETKFIKETKTEPRYRLHSVEDKHPGIYEVKEDGIAIPGELYEMTEEQYQYLLANEPPHLYPFPVTLEGGGEAIAMLYPREIIAERNYLDVSNYNGWTAYKASKS
ncbi:MULTISPECIES: gamma-glutamylcyclotransferase [Spirulina sp. CCY15215]|uniref:allophanate hydrolase-related protein n=1 Tax=Spirulina sp. CCY15215 TaxID=2767591 RepID=UPI00194E776E|nr:gamma-glutamylcyclotransferase [Spirulina major]